MQDVFFISDTHFHHSKIISYGNRPFSDVLEMNSVMVENWNKVVKNRDKVFFLGDFSFGSRESSLEILKQLRGEKTVLKGNHDRGRSFWEGNVKEFSTYPIIFDNFFMLSHEPLFMNESMPYLNIHGHIHQNSYVSSSYFNVSVECIDYTPISYDEIRQRKGV